MDKLNSNRRLEKIPRAKKTKKSDDTKKSKKEATEVEDNQKSSDEELDKIKEPGDSDKKDKKEKESVEDSKKQTESEDESDGTIEPKSDQEVVLEPEPESAPESAPEPESELEPEKKEDDTPGSEEIKIEETIPEPSDLETEKSETPEKPEKESEVQEIEKDEPEPEEIEVKESQSEIETEPSSESEIKEPDVESEDLTPEPDEVDSEAPETESLGVEKFESKIIEYNDFLPTKDTITVITHLDVDGVLCVAAINKMLNSKGKVEEGIKEKEAAEEKEAPEGEESIEATEDGDEIQNRRLRVFFTSPTKVFNTLAKSIPDLNKIQDDDFQIGELYVCDLPVHRDTLLGASIYDQIKWFDHHEIEPSEQYNGELENSELLIDSLTNSATSIICNYFKLDDELSTIADEVDTNEVKSDNAKRIREIVGALRLKFSGSKLKKLLYEFAYELANNVDIINDENYNPIIEDYNKWLDDFRKMANDKIQIQVINDKKVGLLETENAAPVYAIYDSLKSHPEAPFDILAVMIHKYFRIGKDRNNKYKNKRFTKLEFRTHTDLNILELAKSFGGGGHKFACAATVLDGLEINDLIKSIESLNSNSSKNKDNDNDKDKNKE
jgi:hypothetical protein